MKVITIGRNPDNDIVIDDSFVSRHHCQIIQDDTGNFRLVDFGSSNGTFVKEVQITGEVTLNPSDAVRIGNTTLPWRSYFVNAETGKQPQSSYAGADDNIRPIYETRERHGFVTFWLWMGIIGGVITAIYYFLQANAIAEQLYQMTGTYVNPSIMYLLGGISLINIIFPIALLQWKKWGFWALCVSATMGLIINLSMGMGIIISVVGALLGIIILWAILQIKRNGVSCWKNLDNMQIFFSNGIKNKTESKTNIVGIFALTSGILLIIFGILGFVFFTGSKYKEYCEGYAVFVSGNAVYVAGSINKSGSSETDCPTLWKNGVPQRIGNIGNFNSAKSVFVSGNDVYVAITEHEQGRALLWKNGNSQQLGGMKNGNQANSVCVAGNDVYVAGVDNEKPTLWKNGVPQHLSESGCANSVIISGNDIYVVGYEGDYFQGRATIWENGIVHYLSENVSIASSILISNGDVYVAGEENHHATLWKNNVPQQLSNENNSEAYSVAVLIGDVYVVGCGFNEKLNAIAVLWKNGIEQRIDNKLGYQATQVVVDNNNVYITGASIDSCPLWKYDIDK